MSLTSQIQQLQSPSHTFLPRTSFTFSLSFFVSLTVLKHCSKSFSLCCSFPILSVIQACWFFFPISPVCSRKHIIHTTPAMLCVTEEPQEMLVSSPLSFLTALAHSSLMGSGRSPQNHPASSLCCALNS